MSDIREIVDRRESDNVSMDECRCGGHFSVSEYRVQLEDAKAFGQPLSHYDRKSLEALVLWVANN